jgi:DNA polymerase III delta prime subunit
MTTFKKAVKHEAKLRLAIAGPSGSGKTYSALAIATALGKKVAVVDTESGSASRYADIFDFDVMELEAPFSPQRYIDAINAARDAGYDVVVVDSLSHAWAGSGGVLEIKDDFAKKTAYNDYTAWGPAGKVQGNFIEAMIRSGIHLIVTMRSKTKYVMEEYTKPDGKKAEKPVKVGMAPVQRDDVEYEFDLFFEMDIENNAVVSKTRFPEFETGSVIHKPNSGVADALRRSLSGEAPPPWYTKAPDDKVKFVEFVIANVAHLSDPAVAMVAIKAVLNGANFTAVDKSELAKTVSQWQPAPKPSPEPEPDTIDFETGELIPTPAPTANAFSTQ